MNHRLKISGKACIPHCEFRIRQRSPGCGTKPGAIGRCGAEIQGHHMAIDGNSRQAVRIVPVGHPGGGHRCETPPPHSERMNHVAACWLCMRISGIDGPRPLRVRNVPSNALGWNGAPTTFCRTSNWMTRGPRHPPTRLGALKSGNLQCGLANRLRRSMSLPMPPVETALCGLHSPTITAFYGMLTQRLRPCATTAWSAGSATGR